MKMKNLSLLFILLFVISSCQKNKFDIVNLNGNRITALGHGGMGIANTYPLNTFESILNSLSIGADGTEIDVQMTKDGVLVAFHSESLEDKTDATGKVYTKTWDQIKSARYKDPIYTDYRIISLDELFSNISNLNEYTFFLDCKNFNPDTSVSYLNAFTDALVQIIDKHKLGDKVYIELKRVDVIETLRRKRPDLKIFIYTYFDKALEIVDEYQLQGIAIAVDNISKEEVIEAHEKGIMIVVFNAHSKSRNIDAIEKNVDFIQSDKLKHLIKVLK